jgi:hypothetical protein
MAGGWDWQIPAALPGLFDLAEQWIRRDTDSLAAPPSAAPGHLIADRVVIENRLAAKGEVT